MSEIFLASLLGCLLAIEVRAQIIRAVVVPYLRWKIRRQSQVPSIQASRHPSPWVAIGAAAVEYDRTGDLRALTGAAKMLSRSLSDDDRRQLGAHLTKKTKEA